MFLLFESGGMVAVFSCSSLPFSLPFCLFTAWLVALTFGAARDFFTCAALIAPSAVVAVVAVAPSAVSLLHGYYLRYLHAPRKRRLCGCVGASVLAAHHGVFVGCIKISLSVMGLLPLSLTGRWIKRAGDGAMCPPLPLALLVTTARGIGYYSILWHVCLVGVERCGRAISGARLQRPSSLSSHQEMWWPHADFHAHSWL